MFSFMLSDAELKIGLASPLSAAFLASPYLTFPIDYPKTFFSLCLCQVVLHYTCRDLITPAVQHSDITVTLVRKPGKGLGLSVVGRRDGPGVFISALVGHPTLSSSLTSYIALSIAIFTPLLYPHYYYCLFYYFLTFLTTISRSLEVLGS